MKRLIAIVVCCWAGVALASSGGSALHPAGNSLSDTASLQRGARTFVNYCLSCHSAQYMRYNRMAEDLGLTEDMVVDNMLFTDKKVGDTMTVAMRGSDASQWFGNAPPDLSVVARARGTDWLYSFLTGFYADPKKPTGVNNIIFADTAMPHVLWELQGVQKMVTRFEETEEGEEHEVFDHFELATPGIQSELEYQRTVRDLVNFLEYMGEPAKLKRYHIGMWVLVYLVIFTLAAYLLKKEFWRDVH
ncbi:MAG: cytochrome c1 [Gammaproteobacteria bacterium]|nr:cytochrome c1 [Gammaproteobacteria bacterium]